MEGNTKKRSSNKGVIAAMAVILAFLVLLNSLSLTVFDAIFSRYLGKIKLSGEENLYYSSDYDSNQELIAAEQETCEEIAANGIVLLENKEGSQLPYAKGTTFSVFSHSSVDWVATGSGSGGGTGNGNIKDVYPTVKEVLENGGFHVNETLWKFYESGNGSSYVRGIGSVDYGKSDPDFSIHECPLSVIKSEKGLENTFDDTTAMFVLSRTGGEGTDEPRSMITVADSAEDKAKHYLEPDSTELEIISYLNENFSDVLIVVNTNNMMELGWVNDYENIHTVLYVPATGMHGLNALGQILNGEINPSGHLVDTAAYDAFSSPASENIDEGLYFPEGSAPTGAENDSWYYYYNVYQEGIYVGYRYYETRYEDAILGQGNAGDYDYAATVQYPFGYGLSLTEFEWGQFKTEWEDKQCTVSVEVKNTGDRAGRDVVQIYVQSPYTDYDKENKVEKSSVQLVGYAKTDLLEPGASQNVTVTFDERQLASYDYVNARTYILDAGTYYITAASDAHAAINNILLAKDATLQNALVASPSEKTAGNVELTATYIPENTEVDTTTYSVDEKSQAAITNQLDAANLEGLTYLSRQDWVGTYPEPYGEVSSIPSWYNNQVNGGTQENPQAYLYKTDIPMEDYNRIRSTETTNPELDSFNDEIKTGVSTELELSDLIGVPIEDERWDELIAGLSENELTDIITKSGYGTEAIRSANKPAVTYCDGPTGLSKGYIFPCNVMLGMTWDISYAKRVGNFVGEDGLAYYVCGWYGPGLDTHRTPFSGRNFEYFSEDPLVTSVMGAAEVEAATAKGIICYTKHFAFNDFENHRGDGSSDRTGYGVCVWTNEQAAREIYLKGFEQALKLDSPLSGIMTSFNRIGYIWAGGCYELITGIVRNEWGFDGVIHTDFDNGGYMDDDAMLYAGADTKLSYFGTSSYTGEKLNVTKNSAIFHYSKEAAKHLLYAEANSAVMNGVGGDSTVRHMPVYQIILIGVDALGILILILLFVKYKKIKKEIALV